MAGTSATPMPQRDGGVHGAAHILLVVGAEILADDHGGAGGDAAEEADDGVDDGTHRAHGRQGVLADKVAHYDRIHGVV